MIHLAIYGTDDLKKSFLMEKEAIRIASGIPPINGTVDLYPDNLAILAALNLDYKPKPAVMSHGAYTSVLAKMDANHLLRENAPQNIIFNIDLVDYRYPSLDDSHSWPVIWTRYAVSGYGGDYILLHRLDKPKTFSITKIHEFTVPLRSPFIIPDLQGLIWTEIEIKPTRLGRLINTLYKLPALYMAVKLKSGLMDSYRIIPEMAKTGFLLSPLIKDTADFNSLMIEKRDELLQNNTVEAVLIVSDRWRGNEGEISSLYDNNITIRLYRLDF